MTLHRFHAPVAAGRAQLRPAQLRQIHTVLRLRDGDQIAVFDGSGQEWRARLKGTVAELAEPIEHAVEPAVQLTLFQALIRPARMELVLQKGTELGVSCFVPFLAERSVAAGDRRMRWQAIVTEAAEQSGRRLMPSIEPVLAFDQAVAQATGEGVAFLLWEGASEPRLSAPGKESSRLALIVGPEGGFTEEEVRQARARGAISVSLGRRILRAETAALAATAILMHLQGEM
ncbi:MAG: 16S rRNA (uracil(1498)-N(3))-methyltransferase [Chloroflexota bacterium]|nr:16S rRNA (uracil(1498)-N(3))-methyltransferase [Chloroflexota bacterium]